jgi:hypothetical protein
MAEPMTASGRSERIAMHARFGELLGRIVELSPHDVHEILAEQQSTRRRFGEIALSWGLCRPEHIWRAWAEQAIADDEVVDLDAVGVDAQAVSQLHGELAMRLRVIPIRSFEDQIVIATPRRLDELDEKDVAAIRASVDKTPRFVRADLTQINELIEAYYQPVA